MTKKLKLAVFDIDGTIFRSSLLIELFNELVQRGIFPQQAATEVRRSYLRWLDRKGHYNDYLRKLVNVHYKYQSGCSVSRINAVIRAVVDRQKDRVYRYPRDLVRKLKSRGYHLLAISNSQHFMVQRFATRMGFDAAIGRVLETVNGTFTGRSLMSGIPFPVTAQIDKIQLLEQYIADNHFHADLRHSIAVGDSEGDLPLLSHVGNPIAFNPSLQLARIAKRKGWDIVVERKDVVYRMRDMKFVPVKARHRTRNV